ncbi:DUF4189 domain-containing protein [Xanthomonas campestris pv. paulliniae]|uniref:DUF4189 domain-containing protein n=1 Tax=Xanthomonas euvesicatoria TaxID=456327 RepID=UPI001C492933|nr:DUF4189 domain-containing protein [Xanthomonas campestris pv. paulliniae]
MKFYWSLVFLLVFAPNFARAEGGCPPGQYPIGGQGAVGCAPMPQNNSQPQARPLGKWIKTWGAIAMGSIDSVVNYGVSTGKFSKSEAQNEAMAKCASHGEKDCNVTLTYFNQCAAISTPEVDGKQAGGGVVQFAGSATIAEASARASSLCRNSNKPPAQCTIIYSNCTEQVFQRF